jgi:putative ABC transport system permease protein
MFFVTYLRRELRRRMRQAVFIALGLAVGVGLVVTVVAASTGVKKAQADVLRSLYGVGTDITVTGKPPSFSSFRGGGGGGVTFQGGGFRSGGPQICQNGKCHSAAGQTIDSLRSAAFNSISQSKVTALGNLKDVQAVAAGLVLNDTKFTFPKSFGQPGGQGQFTPPTSFSVDGVDTSKLSLGPLSAGTITSGHTLTSAEANSDVAVVDSGYAKSNKLKVGSTVSIANNKFAVIGIVAQPQGGSPDDVYIPLARAQALGTSGSKSLKGDVNSIYVTAASAADIPSVQQGVNKLLPGDTVTTAASLAAEVTGSISSASKLANDLGKWLAILVLIAAVAVASLLTLAAVARRVREFGTLKALGWRSKRIIAQVMGESLIIGIIGGAIGVGLGFAGAAIVTSAAPKLSATIPGPTSPRFFTAGGGGGGFGGGGFGGRPRLFGQAPTHALSVPMSASVTVNAIAASCSIVGGLLVSSFGTGDRQSVKPTRPPVSRKRDPGESTERKSCQLTGVTKLYAKGEETVAATAI